MTLEDLYRLLRSTHVQAQGIVDTIDEPLVVLDQSLTVLTANRAFFHTFHAEADDIIGHDVFKLGNGQWDIPELRRLLLEVVPKSAAILGFEVTHDFPAIGTRTFLLNARRLARPDNHSSSILLSFEDVTQRRDHRRAQDILLAETRHRLKNLVSVVRAIAKQTTAEGRSGEEYRDAFMGRVLALVDAQDFSFDADQAQELASVLERALKLVDPSRVSIGPGPAVVLAPAKVAPLRMIIHELLTNALKYGALSGERGRVRVTWEATADGDQLRRIHWREEQGPPVTPPGTEGFGTRMIQFAATYDLGGTAELSFEPEGFRAVISIPLA